MSEGSQSERQTEQMGQATLTPEQRAMSPEWGAVYELAEKFGYGADAAKRAQLVSKETGVDLAAMATLLHGSLAPGVEQTPIDRQMNTISPDGEIKHRLMEPSKRFSLFQKASELIQGLGAYLQPGQESDFLERASNIVALTVAISHPFEDGNGRTARTLASLIRDGYNPQDEESMNELHTLGQNRPTKGFRVNSYIPKVSVEDPASFLESVAALDVPLTADAQDYRQRTAELFTSPYGTEPQAVV